MPRDVSRHVKLITWNTGHRTRRIAEQVEALQEREPDIIALQEVTHKSVPLLSSLLERAGYRHHAHSLPVAKPASKARMLGVMTASRYPLSAPEDIRMTIPWPEKSLSVVLRTPHGPVELYNVHVPPGSTNGWIKVETLEGVFEALATRTSGYRVLCGDFNAPRSELQDGRIVTWAQRVKPDGRVTTRARMRGGSGARWDSAERNVLEGLASFGMVDVYRSLNGIEGSGYSWVLERSGRRVCRRFDHVFASEGLGLESCTYLHSLREASLSDHSALEAVVRFLSL